MGYAFQILVKSINSLEFGTFDKFIVLILIVNQVQSM